MLPWQRKSNDNRLSLEISNALETQGYGLCARDETKRTQLIGQFMEEYFVHAKSITSGGRAEGTAIEGSSDSDIMGVIGGIVAADNDQDRRQNVIYMSAVRTGCSPGYCKLKFSTEQYGKLRSCLNVQANDMIDRIRISDSIVHLNGDNYLSSKMFSAKVTPGGMIPADNFKDVAFEVNGPAIRNADVDFVQAFEMSQWPEEANIWRTRQRENKWPSEQLLNRLEGEISCYVVAIGNKSSKEFDIEWRLSFVEIERELIWSMNETQFKCFVLLKMLKKLFHNYSCLNEITTYHVKNIMFWMCEQVPECEWIPQNLISCVKSSLKRLETCIKEMKLDHYINPKNNLFQSKTFEFKEIEKAIYCLQEFGLYNLILMETDWAECLDKLLLVSPEVVGYSNTCKSISRYCAYKYDPDFATSFLKKFPEAGILLPCVNIAMAKTKWRNKLMSGAHIDIDKVINKIKEGSEMDYSTSILNAALVYFMHGYYDKVLIELGPLFSDTAFKIYVSSLGGPLYVCFKSGEMHNKKKENFHNIDDLQHDRKNLVSDFCPNLEDICVNVYGIFKTYLNTLPYPLALHFCLSTERERCRLNPVVICYYLLYMSHFKLNHLQEMDEIMRRFKMAVHASNDLKDYHHSLSLLGHCLYCTGDVEAAFKCFAESIMIKSVRNAAVYQMAILINDRVCNIP